MTLSTKKTAGPDRALDPSTSPDPIGGIRWTPGHCRPVRLRLRRGFASTSCVRRSIGTCPGGEGSHAVSLYSGNRGAERDRSRSGPCGVGAEGGQATTVSWGRGRIPPELIALVPESIARENQVVPVASEGETVIFVAVDHQNIALADKLSFLIARKVDLVPATRDEIAALLNATTPVEGPGVRRVGRLDAPGVQRSGSDSISTIPHCRRESRGRPKP